MAELKRCAHCGGTARACKCDPTGQWYAATYDSVSRLAGRQLTHNFIMCGECGIRTRVYATDKGAFNAWNRRADNGS